MYSCGPPHMDVQEWDDQHELTYSNYVRTQDVTLKTCRRWWMIGRNGERGSGISALAARHDDDDSCLFYYISSFMKSIVCMWLSKNFSCLHLNLSSGYLLEVCFFYLRRWLYIYIYVYIYIYIGGSLNKFPDFFVWALLLIVHTWNSSRLRSSFLRLQCTCCIVATTSGRPHGSPLVWACQWPLSQPLSSRQLSELR